MDMDDQSLNHSIAVIDVETTGLFPMRNDRIVEIAVVIMAPDGQIQSEYETLINPGRDIGPTRIHGISAGEVLKAPAFAHIAGDLLAILSGASVIAGHNVNFDRNFLVMEYARLGIMLPKVPMLCTCQLFGRKSLQACCAALGIKFEGTQHRAIVDARATAILVARLVAGNCSILAKHRIADTSWPGIEANRTPCFTRDHAR